MTWFWLAIFSALLSATAAILQKKVLSELKALDFTLILSAVVAALSTPLLAFTGTEGLNADSMLYLLVKSVLNALAFLCIMTALKNLEIGRTLPLLAASPMIIALLAFIILGEMLSAYEIIGMTLIVAGTFILELKKNESLLRPFHVFKSPGYHRIIFAALILISASAVMDKFILVKFKISPILFVVIQNYFFLIIFLIIYLFTRKFSGEKIFTKERSKYLVITILIIAIVTIGYRLAQIESTKLAPVGIVISLKRLSVLFAVLIGAKLFKEESYMKKVAATILIVTGAMLIYED
ncbi:MAG: EamA family transporter [Ignavibacteria bacterium]|nr:EamA family transporter [Ignavibacteria bacterium]